MEILNPRPGVELYEGKWHWRPSDPTERCVVHLGPEGGPDGEGRPYEVFMCLYPWLQKHWYSTFEQTWRPYWAGYYMRDRGYWIPIVWVSMYLVMVYWGPKLMKNRKPWNLRKSLMAWNLFLSIFSFVGFFKVLPLVLHLLYHYTWIENMCFDPWIHAGHNEGGMWIGWFCFSKFIELFDTFFIIVNKKPLIFLHWYHHLSVLLYCWFYGIYTAPSGIYFCQMNYGVHTIMYFYYFLMSAKMKPKWFNAKIITLVQIAQMVIGSMIVMAGMYLNWIDTPHCFTRPINAVPSAIMYVSYMVLFMKFFYDRYAKQDAKKKKVEGETTKKTE